MTVMLSVERFMRIDLDDGIEKDRAARTSALTAWLVVEGFIGRCRYTERLASKRHGRHCLVEVRSGWGRPVVAREQVRNVEEASVAVPCLRDERLGRRSSHGTVVGSPPEGFRSLAWWHQDPGPPDLIGLVPADWLCSCSPES